MIISQNVSINNEIYTNKVRIRINKFLYINCILKQIYKISVLPLKMQFKSDRVLVLY